MSFEERFPPGLPVVYNPIVYFLRSAVLAASLSIAAAALCPGQAMGQQPAAAAARILLLPRRAASGEPATLAVLDLEGRLTPGVTVVFATGTRVTTDATGRASFLAPSAPGTVFASIEGRPGRAALNIVASAQGAEPSLAVRTAPRFVSLADRFELSGSGFCNVADANRVTVEGRPALVLAASSLSLTILPPEETRPGPAEITVACGNRGATSFTLTIVSLELQASGAHLAPGERRELLVRILGTNEKLTLTARNLAPEIAELAGGNPVRSTSTGGAGNSARFQVLGRARGSFLISIRLVPVYAAPHP